MLRRFNGQAPAMGEGAWVDATAVVIGDVHLASEASIWPLAVVRGDVNTITIGERSNIQDGTVIHVTHDGPYTQGGIPTRIGNDVTVGHNAIIHACDIGDRVLVGMGASVIDGAVVEDDVMIAANALVPPNKRLESGYLYVGAPVKAARELTDEEREELTYSARHYVALKRRHEAGG